MKELYVDTKNSSKISSSFQADLSQVAGLFEVAKQRGEIDPDTDTFEAVTIWWACYTMVLLYALRLPHFDVDA
jgi:hypothetical protein